MHILNLYTNFNYKLRFARVDINIIIKLIGINIIIIGKNYLTQNVKIHR